MSEVFFVQMVGTNIGKCEWVWKKILRWQNPRWLNSRWQNIKIPAIITVKMRMNEFESDGISLSQQSEWSGSVFEWIWEKITRYLNPRWQCLHPTWQKSRWLPSSTSVRMNEWSFFFCANGGNQSWQVWVSLKENTKMAVSKMDKFKMEDFKIPRWHHSS